MAVAWYKIGVNQMMNGNIDWVNDDIRATLLDTSYTYSADHATMESASFPTADRVGDNVALSGNTVASDGAFDADDTIVTSVADSETIGAVVLYKHVTGSSSSDIPLVHIDSGTGFDLSTNGNNVKLTWPVAGIISRS